ncbi:MAG: filamentous hemagglutinin N-terminal domain-containing protein [Xenococcaceae cyanobacterium]
MSKITGGKRVGNNLFYYFEEFSIFAGMEAIFANATEIQNIFALITGNKISCIDGPIQTLGEANLFLLNPNGIVFEANTSLDLGGSFIATTANQIDFADEGNFSVHEEPQESSKINTPFKLSLNGNTGTITVNGMGNQVNNKSLLSPITFDKTPLGLSVKKNKTLALIGNELNFHSGVVTTEGGDIYLNSLESGSVEIDRAKNQLTFLNENIISDRDINLDRQSLIYVHGKNRGNISVTGRNINLTDGSFIFAQNKKNSLRSSIHIKASENLTLSIQPHSSNINLRSAIRSETLNTGGGAIINIFADRLLLQDGARIRTYSFGDGVGGDLNINVANLIQLASPSSIIATTYGKGNAGSIYVSASQLNLKLGGISSSTFGEGNGGSIEINASLIEIEGNFRGNRGSIAATSWASGNTGNVKINTSELRVIEGASLSSSSFADGNAGNINISASQSIKVIGSQKTSQAGKNPQSTIRAAVQSVSPGAKKAFNLPDIPSGNSGNIIINTPVLDIARGGVVTVENQGRGKAGKLQINVNSLNLDEAGTITAAGIENNGKVTIETNNLSTNKLLSSN